ncbi:MAG: DUF1232 domain-containing protein [Solirubrobacterales bacterium]
MSSIALALVAFAVFLVLYVALVLTLYLSGRGGDARLVARFIPDCVVLFRRLLGDDRVPRWRKLVLLLMLGYLVLPVDLVPDFIPIAGQLDDAILVIVALAWTLRAGGPELIEEHWPGPARGAAVLTKAAFGPGVGRADSRCASGGRR